jgi:hypothetical protein
MNQFSSNLLLDTFLPVKREMNVMDQPFILDIDLDGDQMDEIAIGYSDGNQYYVMVLKAINRQLKMIANILLKGKIHYFHAHHITSTKQKDLVIGVECEGDYLLSIIGHMKGKYLNRLNKEYRYDQIKIEDIDQDHLEEIAIWQLRADQSYYIQTLRFYNGKLYPIDQTETSKAIVVDLRELNQLYQAKRNTIDGSFWGYINKQGDFVIKPQFEEARSFHNNRAIVRQNKLYGYINKQGDFVIEPIFQTMNDFKENRSIVSNINGFHVIDETGKMLTKNPYSYISDYQDGRARFYIEGDAKTVYGYLDRMGNVIIEANYLEASDFINGKAIVKDGDNRYCLINTDGDVIQNYPYFYVGEYGDNKLAFRPNQTSFYGYINETGTVLIEPQFNLVLPFEEDTAIVNKSTTAINQYGLIDVQGNYIIEAEYNEIKRLGSGRLAVGKARDKQKPYLGSHFAVANTKGELLTPFIFDGVSDFKQNLASALYDDKTLMINIEGRVMKELPVFSGTGQAWIENELLRADIDYQTSYYDLLGRLIYQENQEIPITQGKWILIKKVKPNKDYLVYYPELILKNNPEIEQKINDGIMKHFNLKPVNKNETLNYTFYSHFNVRFYHKHLLELCIENYHYELGSAHGVENRIELHIDLQTGRFYELTDLFNNTKAAINKINLIIQDQLVSDQLYQTLYPDGFKGIAEDQPFYVTQDDLHLYFEPYEIAPYYVGFPSFKIPFNQIIDIIDRRGAFWQSFH